MDHQPIGATATGTHTVIITRAHTSVGPVKHQPAEEKCESHALVLDMEYPAASYCI
jgi:hypothetical protein